MNTFNGLFITFEGPNGVGKSTIIDNVSEELIQQGFNTVKTKEPTNSTIGDFLRQSEELYRGKTLACIAAADRHYHIKNEIIPALNDHKIVLSDRYVESSIVLQQIDNVDLEFIWAIHRDIIVPDLSVILFTSSDTLEDRLKLRSKRSHFEKIEGGSQRELDLYFQAVEFLKNYGFNFIVLNNESNSIEENSRMIVDNILALTNNSKSGHE